MERKGFLTEEQVAKADTWVVFKNPALEIADGPIMSMIDDYGLDIAARKLHEKNPILYKLVIGIIDAVFAIIPATADED